MKYGIMIISHFERMVQNASVKGTTVSEYDSALKFQPNPVRLKLLIVFFF